MICKAIMVFVLLFVTALGAIPAHAQNLEGSPQLLLLNYYNRLNLHDYQVAYSLWYKPSQLYQDFVDGFKDTNRITPYLGDLQPSSTYQELGRLPAVLLGYHTDGTKVSYAGCVSFTADQQNYRILNADFQLISDKQFPDGQTIERFLAVDCYKPSATTITPKFSDPVNDPAYAAMVGYYDLINQKDFAKAYDIWLKPLPGPKPNGAPAEDYRLPFTRFVDGYKDTGYINVYLGDYQNTGAFAGHSYLDGILPVVLVDEHIDGSIVSFYGCYVLGRLDSGDLGIVSGMFLPLVATDVPTSQAILGSLRVDCTQLDLKY